MRDNLAEMRSAVSIPVIRGGAALTRTYGGGGRRGRLCRVRRVAYAGDAFEAWT